jgi:hypothetical protein
VRHLYGVALAVGMTLVMFFGGAWGYLQLLRLAALPGQTSALPANGGSLLSDHNALLALGVLAGTALLAGLLAALPRVSPLASGLPGLLLLAWTVLFVVRVQEAVTLIPLRSYTFGVGWEALLFNGILGAVGVVMLIPLFIPSRWRARPARVKSSTITQEVTDYLESATPENEAATVAATTEEPEIPQQEIPQQEQEQRPNEPPLVGTVLPRRADWPADAMRITNANQALRNTGSFRQASGTDFFRPANSQEDGQRGPTNGSLFGRPNHS